MNPPPSPPPSSPSSPPERCRDCRWRQPGLFLPADAEDLATVQAFRGGTEKLRAGRTLVAEGRLPIKLYTVYDGWAFRYKSLADGRRQILNFLLPGDFIGLQGEFADEATHGVEALTDLQLCVFPRGDLWPLFQRKPEFAYDVTWLAAKQEQLLDENLVTLGQRNAAERVAMLLVVLWRRADRLGLGDGHGGVEFPLTQQHIADALGLSLVHTNKTLRKLERLGLHRVADGRLYLLQPAALARIADFVARPIRPQPLI
ncbi:Crp/Fnr family transcriptional regulator [Ottowia sp.]|uniref:Crp/Fnr family transcriptional regulator n=1 Tax=Ottowia sp. TaxID=1898956 RepID=UPI001D31C4C1|nr:Crp/Fnr family transcriptional regulator [Ottowia sp.]MCB2034216.1 Crp/Fnr family transcriptional regulator [Ottowia sp.]MCP5256893.1 Crp/Fnr family transcriptional regulator [Burkholderiaceae bacterium]HRW73733.1 Crp/Fnr family transcriptional regulator [Ottowia sp.]